MTRPYYAVCRHCGNQFATWVWCLDCGAADARDPNPFVPTDTLHGPPAPCGPTTEQRLIWTNPTFGTEECRILCSARGGLDAIDPRPWAGHAELWELQRRRLLDYAIREFQWQTTELGFQRINAIKPGLGDKARPYVTPWRDILGS